MNSSHHQNGNSGFHWAKISNFALIIGLTFVMSFAIGCSTSNPTGLDEMDMDNKIGSPEARTADTGNSENEFPSAPVGLTADLVDTTPLLDIRLEWTMGEKVQSFMIERLNTMDNVWVNIATVDGLERSYTDTNLDLNTPYQYRVCSERFDRLSAYSNIAEVFSGTPAIVGEANR